jgi:peptidoglycan/xylan/chitin deacetylase (PgdA/CDA1 family)
MRWFVRLTRRGCVRAGSILLTLFVPALFGPHATGGVPGAEETSVFEGIRRSVAVTFDDLPGSPPALVENTAPALREMTARLLAAIGERRIPATGFVTTGLLRPEGGDPGETEARRAVLRQWLEAGHDLGNHSHSHRSLNTTPLEEYEQDVVRAESEMEPVLGAGRRMTWFRHPFLHVGTDLEKRRSFEAWVTGRGYRIAVVTIDNDDYIYAAAYASALRRKEPETARKIGEDYLRYMDEVFAFYERVEADLFGRPIRHVLLLHANALNAGLFGRLADGIAARGYGFISLEEAVADEVYSSPDTWTGPWGISWVHHWALTAGKERAPSPDPPAWVMRAYEERDRGPAR